MSVGQDQFKPGQRLGGFEILEGIGRGGMGSVYLAEDTRLRRKVALKVILPELADQPDFRRRFEAEARAAAAIEHPNLVPVYAAGLLDGHLFLAMRFVAGQNLNQALDRHGPLAHDTASAILGKIAGALDAAHAAGLVHRDVTPANILLEGELGAEGVFLTDFGLVRGLDTGETQLTRTNQVIANLDYAAPEQIRGGRVDARTDVYALGCVLYRMRSGERPFPGTDTQKMWKIVNDLVPPIGRESDPLDAVIARATAKDPERRYPSAGDLARAATEPGEALTARLPERSVATGPAAAGYFEASDGDGDAAPTQNLGAGRESRTAVLPSPAPTRAGRRRALAIGAGALAALAGVAIAATMIANGGSDPAAQTVVREKTVTTSEPAPDPRAKPKSRPKPPRLAKRRPKPPRPALRASTAAPTRAWLRSVGNTSSSTSRCRTTTKTSGANPKTPKETPKAPSSALTAATRPASRRSPSANPWWKKCDRTPNTVRSTTAPTTKKGEKPRAGCTNSTAISAPTTSSSPVARA